MSEEIATVSEDQTRPASTESDKSEVMQAFETLETEELSRYCSSISVDGVIAQSVSVALDPGHTLWCANGALLAYDSGIQWESKIPGGAGKAVSRMLSGEGARLTHVTSREAGAEAVIGANEAGQLATWDLSRGAIVCTPGSFVAALGDVDIDVTTAKKAGAMLFGGGGMFLQRLSGDGIAVVHGSGDFVHRKLDPGEELLISTGNLSVFSGDVDYDVTGVGGCLKSIFGGEGLFMTKLTGPGWAMVQTIKHQPVSTDDS